MEVLVVHRGRRRRGRGFSIPELKKVGISIKAARKFGLWVDERRKSCYEENIEILKKILKGKK